MSEEADLIRTRASSPRPFRNMTELIGGKEGRKLSNDLGVSGSAAADRRDGMASVGLCWAVGVD